MKRAIAWVTAGWVATAAGLHAAGSQATGSQAPAATQRSLAIASMSGRDLFEFYCASCHGQGGRGDGPVGAALTTRPADLTVIARGNGGVFPRERVEGFVTNGNPIEAHGTSDMPVWGPIFLALDPSDTRARVRLDNLVDYIRSLQAP